MKEVTCQSFLTLCCCLLALTQSIQAARGNANQVQVCLKELENANRTVANWGDNMEQMINDSKLSSPIRESVHNQANSVLDAIEDYGNDIRTKTPYQLAKDLVNIRRSAYKLSLDVYLQTFDMRWPQNSLALGNIVDRVQQACLDQAAVRTLEAPPPEVLAIRATNRI